VSDSNGDYSFRQVEEGNYEIEASAEGFVSQTYGPDTSPEVIFQPIRASTRLTGIDFRLQREAVIRGVVINATGQPIAAGIPIAAVRKEKRSNGSERLFPASETKTNENGEFVLKKLSPGSYLVCVNGPHGYNAAADAGGWYRETWYRNASSENGADQIPLQEGEERRDIRIKVERERRYRVVVWPFGPEGEPQHDSYDIHLLGRSHLSSRQADGSYVIPDVPPGQYKLASTAWSGSRYIGAGDTAFDISHNDVTVHVRVGGLGSVSGIVKWLGTASGSLTDVMIGIGSQEGAAQGRNLSADGHFTFASVLPGRYEFRLLKNPTDAILRTVRCGGTPVTEDSPLQIGDRQKIADCELLLESAHH